MESDRASSIVSLNYKLRLVKGYMEEEFRLKQGKYFYTFSKHMSIM